MPLGQKNRIVSGHYKSSQCPKLSVLFHDTIHCVCRIPSLAFYAALMGLREMGMVTNQQEALATTCIVNNKSALSLIQVSHVS